MGLLILKIAIVIELFFMIWSLVTKERHDIEKTVVRAGAVVIMVALLLLGVLDGVARYGILIFILLVQAGIGYFIWLRKKEKTYKPGRLIGVAIGNSMLYTMALFVAIMFPQYEEPQVTGSHEVEIAEYTWVDESRVETYADTGENRALTVKIWYPKEEGTYPLVVFSHGAFGMIDSNYSTCQELASNGYVAVSIAHPYHAMFVEDTSGKITIADMDFVNQVYADNGADTVEAEKRVYEFSKEFMKIRTDDEKFVLDTILDKAANGDEGAFSRIDSENIGLFGHSMGGASSVALGRQRDDVDAVIDLEGTMCGEYLNFVDGAYVYNEEPYPIPLLDMNSRDVYNQAQELPITYVNFYVGENAIDFREEVIEDAGHLNFTDLPMVSPILAKMLGVGKTDAKHCIEEINAIILEFFDEHLKGQFE